MYRSPISITSIIVIITVIILLFTTTTSLLLISAQHQDPPDYKKEFFDLGSPQVPLAADSITYSFSDLTISEPNTIIYISRPLKFGKTLVIENVNNKDGGVEFHGILCPGASVIVRNVTARFVSVSRSQSESAGKTCFQECEFPVEYSQDEPHRVPYDTDDRFLIKFTVENNQFFSNVNAINGFAVGIKIQQTEACSENYFNNTRVAVNITNNNMTTVTGTSVHIEYENFFILAINKPVYTFLRNVIINNNNMTLTQCQLENPNRNEPGIDMNNRRNILIDRIGTSDANRRRPLTARAEGVISVTDNNMNQANCLSGVPNLRTGYSAVQIHVTDYGAHPLHLPLTASIRRNHLHHARQLTLVSLDIRHSRVGYFHTNYSSLASPITETSSEMTYYSNHEEHKKIFPRVMFEENNSTLGEIHATSTFGCLHLKVVIDEDSYEISNYVREHGADRAVPTSNIDLEYLELLKYYPEKEVLGSAIIRNNSYYYKVPKRNYVPNSNYTGINEEASMSMRITFVVQKCSDNLGHNRRLPRNYFSPPNLLPESVRQAAILYNYSSLLYTFESLIIEENSVAVAGLVTNFGLFLPGSNFIETLLIKNNYFEEILYQEGIFNTRQQQYHAEFGVSDDCTIHRLIVINNIFNITDMASEGLGRNAVNHFFEVNRVFGVVQFTIRDNTFWLKSANLGCRVALEGIYANYYENLHDFPFISSSNPRFFNKTTNEFILQEYQSAPRTWEMRNLFLNATSTKDWNQWLSGTELSVIDLADLSFPGGTVIIDNVSLRSDFVMATSLIKTFRNVSFELDRLIVTNLNMTATIFRHSPGLFFYSVFALIRKELTVRNIYYRVSPKYPGRYSGSFGMPDTRLMECMKLMFRWVDVGTTLKSDDEYLRPPFDAASNYEIIDGPTGDDETQPERKPPSNILINVTIENIFARYDSGVMFIGAVMKISLTGLKTSHSLISNPLLIRNVTLIAGSAKEDVRYRPIGAFPIPYVAAANPVKSLAVVALYLSTNFLFSTANDRYREKRDYRFDRIFSTSPSTVPVSLVFEDSKTLFDTECTGNLITLRSQFDDRGSVGDVSIFSADRNVLPPNITLRRVRCETWDLVENKPNVFEHSMILGGASVLQFYQVSAIRELILDEVFAPAFKSIFKFDTVRSSAGFGLGALRITPPSTSFLGDSITNYSKKREDDTRLDNIFHNFDTGDCASFFGNRPLSSYQRIYQALDGRNAPFDGQFLVRLATSSSSAFFRDRVHFTNCLTLTSTLSRSVSQPTPTPSNSILYIPPTRTESSTLVSHTVSNTPYEIPPPPFVLPGEGESRAVLAAAAAGSLVAISVNPSAAAAVARMTSVIDVVNGIAQNDCTGSDDDSSPDLVSAPFQMNFGPRGGGFLLGTVVGNILLNFLMFALTAGGYWSFLKFYRKERRLPSPFAMNSGGRARFLRDSLSFTGLVVGVEILLYSTLSAGFIVSVRNNPLTNFGARAAAIVLTLFIVVACARWCWSLLFSRDRYEKFRRSAGNHQLFGNNNNNSNNSNSNSGRKRTQNHHDDVDTLQREDDDDQHQPGFCSVVWTKVKHVLAIITGEEGQWIFPSSLIGTRPSAPQQQQSSSFFNSDANNKNKNNRAKSFKSNRVITSEDKYLWFYAEPLVEGFTDRLPRFMCVEFGVQALLALSIVVGELAGSGRTGCLVQGCLVILIFMLYFIATLVWRPYNDLLSRITTPATTLIEVITIVIALAEVEIAALSGLVVALSSMQLIVAVVSLLQWVIAVGWPAFRAVVLRGRHRKGRDAHNRDENTNGNNLRSMQMTRVSGRTTTSSPSRSSNRRFELPDTNSNRNDDDADADVLLTQAMLGSSNSPIPRRTTTKQRSNQDMKQVPLDGARPPHKGTGLLLRTFSPPAEATSSRNLAGSYPRGSSRSFTRDHDRRPEEQRREQQRQQRQNRHHGHDSSANHQHRETENNRRREQLTSSRDQRDYQRVISRPSSSREKQSASALSSAHNNNRQRDRSNHHQSSQANSSRDKNRRSRQRDDDDDDEEEESYRREERSSKGRELLQQQHSRRDRSNRRREQ